MCALVQRHVRVLRVGSTQTRRGFAARDALGVKPLAYAWDGEEFLFASEAHVVARARGLPICGHSAAILEYLVAPCFSGVERPMFAGVEYLPPGHWLELDPRGPRYADTIASPSATAPDRTTRRCVTGCSRPCDAAAAPTCRSACSSAAASTRRQSRRSPRNTQPAPPPAFTIAFTGMSSYDYAHWTIVVSDDLPFAKLAAQSLGLPLTVVAAPPEELAADLLRVATSNDALPA